MFGVKYEDPILMKLRKGTVDDPYVDITEQLKIINNRIILKEIPDEFTHVKVSGYTEIFKTVFNQIKTLKSTQFLVDYSNREITFNSSEEGKTVTVTYKGKGIVQYPASAIYVHTPNPYAVDNLQDLIALLQGRVKEFNDAVNSTITHVDSQMNNMTNLINSKISTFDNKLLQQYSDFKNKVDGKYGDFITSVSVKENSLNAKVDNVLLDIQKSVDIANSELNDFSSNVLQKQSQLETTITNLKNSLKQDYDHWNSDIVGKYNNFVGNVAATTLSFQSFVNDKVNNISNLINIDMKNKVDQFEAILIDKIQEFNEDTKEFENVLKEKFDDYDELLFKKYNDYIAEVDAELLRNMAYMSQKKQEFVDYVNAFINLANLKIGDISQSINNARDAINDALTATSAANTAANDARNATEESKKQVESAKLEINNSKLLWQSPPANSYLDIPNVYPDPKVGYTVITLDKGDIFRYNGLGWYKIGNIVGSVPTATSTRNGLLSMDDYNKLQSLQNQHVGEDLKNDLPDSVSTKTIVFVFPSDVTIGVQDIIIQFPYSGIVTNIKAFTKTQLTGYAEMVIEKISEVDFVSGGMWTNIVDNNNKIRINMGDKVQDGSYILTDNVVSANEYFRINVTHIDTTLSNLTVQINIKY